MAMTEKPQTRQASKLTPGPRNLITDIAGLKVGHASHQGARTGVSVIVPDAPAVVSVCVPGGGPGSACAQDMSCSSEMAGGGEGELGTLGAASSDSCHDACTDL